MPTANSPKGRRAKKSAMSSIVIVALALLIFVVAVGIGVSLLSPNEPANTTPSSSEPPVASSSQPPQSSSEPQSSEAPASSDSQSAGTSTSSSSSVPAVVLPQKFDPSLMGDSGYSNIPNYRQINADVKAWLKVPGTNINYPVLHNAQSVYYYLDKDLYKQTSKNGVIYADPAVKFGSASEVSRNTVLYGHNWTNVSANPRIGSASDVMFAQLTAYHHLQFAKVYPYIYYSTEAEEMTWVVFAAFYTDISFNYIVANPDDATFSSIISGAKARSRHNFNVAVTTGDRILTLSTCTRAYGSSDRQRFVVMARLLHTDEEPVEISVTANPNPVLPSL